MKAVAVNGGHVTWVDDEDYERVARYSWHLNDSGYVIRTGYLADRYQCIRLHRWLINAPIGYDVHHRDGDPLNNCKFNLEIKTHSKHISDHQKINASKHGPRNGKIYKGTKFHAGKWEAHIRIDGRKTYLGRFFTEEDAARAYDAAVRQCHPQGAYVNFSVETDEFQEK